MAYPPHWENFCIIAVSQKAKRSIGSLTLYVRFGRE